MVVLVAAILLWMADLQLFGRAPVAAFNGDAAQNRKRKGMGGEDTHLSLHAEISFPVIVLLEFFRGFHVYIYIYIYMYIFLKSFIL